MKLSPEEDTLLNHCPPLLLLSKVFYITFTIAVVCPIPRLLHSIQWMDGVPWLNAELHMSSALQINKTTSKNCTATDRPKRWWKSWTSSLHGSNLLARTTSSSSVNNTEIDRRLSSFWSCAFRLVNGLLAGTGRYTCRIYFWPANRW